MNESMPRRLPTFNGYTIDNRLREFRKVDEGMPMEFIPFASEEGQRLFEQMRAGEAISNNSLRIQSTSDDLESWCCICGNRATDEGFYPCDSEGKQVEPTLEYSTNHWYVCDRCGRIIDQDTLTVVGVRFNNTLTLPERQELYANRN